jgi:hypothetical protein
MQKIKNKEFATFYFFQFFWKMEKIHYKTKSLGPNVIYTFIHFYSYHNGLRSYPKSNTILKAFSN